MKTAVILFRQERVLIDSEYLREIDKLFSSSGFYVGRIEILSCDDDIAFMHLLSELKNTVDNLVILSSEDVEFDIKARIAEQFETELILNENAQNFASAVCVSRGITAKDDYALMPQDAMLIPNVWGAVQGFTLDEQDFTLIYLSQALNEVKVACEKYVIPFLESKYGVKNKKLVLKYCGEEASLLETLKKSTEIFGNEGYSYFIKEKSGDFTVELNFINDRERNSSDVIRYVVSTLKDDIYAEQDESPAQRLFEILQLKEKKIAFAESFTGGELASEIIKNSGASKVLSESIVCYANESKIKRLGVRKEDLFKFGAVSSVVAYQMALGLLRNGVCDVAVSTTGIAGPKSDDTQKPVGLCYIAVGTKEGIHTYKFNLSGNREEITQRAKNKALFLAIKKLKKM